MRKRIVSLFVMLTLCLSLVLATELAVGAVHGDHCVCGKTVCTDSKHSKVNSAVEITQSGSTLKIGDKSWASETVSNGSTYYILPEGSYYLGNDISPNYTIRIEENVTLCLNGHKITGANGKDAIKLSSGSFTLTDCKGGGTITHASEKAGCGVYVASGTFNMYGGSITGNTAQDDEGGGVYVGSGGCTFNMYGGSITGNRATDGGGVYMTGRNSSFYMYGGSITGNSATYGGGVYVNGSTFQMFAGTIGGTKTGEANTATNGGGGVYVTSSGTFTMTGGSITGNTASYGGGVELYGGEFTMKDSASVTGNTATNFGGGVYVTADGTFTMSGGSIGGNTTKGYGGGVYMSGGTFNMSAGTISSNKAAIYGGGVYMSRGTFTMSGGSIGGTNANEANTATKNGGGVYMTGGTFTMSAGSITGNNATNGGGGVCVSSGTFEMKGGSIGGKNSGEANTAANGGGVFVTGGEFTMKDSASITGNNAKYNGGGVYMTIGTFNMYGGSIGGNKVNNSSGNATCGGGVYVGSSCTFTMSGGTIGGTTNADANSAQSGGGVYMNGGTFTMSASENGENIPSITGNNATDNGGGVHVGGGTFTMSAGSITGNNVGVSYGSGGIYISGNAQKFTVSGNIQITGNTKMGTKNENGKYTGGTVENLYLLAGKTITVGGTLTEGAKLGVTLANNYGDIPFTSGWKTEMGGKDPSDYFISDVGGKGFELSGGEVKLNDGHTHYLCGGSTCNGSGHEEETGKTIFAKEIKQEGDKLYIDSVVLAKGNGGFYHLPEGNYFLSSDIDTDTRIQIGAKVTLCLNGHTIKRTTDNKNDEYYQGCVIVVAVNGNFTLTDCKDTGKITHDDGKAGRGVHVEGSTFNMYGGSIAGNSSSNSGGGVLLNSFATFNMFGGEICNNTAQYGGGVYVGGGCTFTMSGGSITGSSAAENGGGVFKNGDFYILGNIQIKNNVKGGTKGSDGKYTGGTANNVYIPVYHVICIGDTLTDGATVGVTLDSNFGESAFTSGWNANMSGKTPSDYFTSDTDEYVAKLNGSELKMVSTHVHNWTYTASGDTITATCKNCPINNGNDFSGGSVTISAPTALTYDGNAKKATRSAGEVLEGGPAFPYEITYYLQKSDNTWEKISSAPTDAGTYKAALVKVVGEETIEAYVIFTIAPKTVTPTIKVEGDPVNIIYNGNEWKPAVKVMDGTTVIPNTEYDVSYSNNIKAGTAAVTVTNKAGGNYLITETSESFTIQQGNPRVSISGLPEYGNVAYGDKFTLTATAETTEEGGAWTWTFDTKYFKEIQKDGNTLTLQAIKTGDLPADSTAITATYASENYWGRDSANVTRIAKMVLTQNDLSYTNTLTKVYDGTAHHTEKISVSVPTVNNIGLAFFVDKESVIYNSKGVDAAYATVTLTNSDLGNNQYYEFENGKLEITLPATITARPITIASATAQNRTYSKGDTGVTITGVTFNGLVGGDTLAPGTDYTATGTVTTDTAGKDKAVAVTVELKNGNYKLEKNTADTIVNIWQKEAPTVTVASISQKWSDTEKKTVRPEWSGIPEDAGTTKYSIIDRTLPEGINMGGTDYTFAPDTGVLTYAVTGATADHAGQTIKLVIKIAMQNYEETEATLEIKLLDKDEQTNFGFAETGKTVTYGDAAFTVAATGAESGSTVTYESSNPAVATVDAGGKVTIKGAGTATITATASETKDYKAATATYTLTVNPKTLTASDLEFTDESITKIYDGSTVSRATVRVKDSAKVNAQDELPAVNGTCEYNSKDVKDAEKVTFTTRKTENDNYILPAGLTLEHAATISAKDITIASATATGRAYSKGDKSVTVSSVTFDGLAEGDDLILGTDYTATGTMNTDGAGENAVTVTVTLRSGNYKLGENTAAARVTITQADAPVLTDIKKSYKYTLTGEQTVGLSGLVPDATGYTVGTAEGKADILSNVSVANGVLKYTLTGTGGAGDTVTLPVTIASANYKDATVLVKITLTARDDQAKLKLLGDNAVVFGKTLTFTADGGSGTGAVTYSVTSGTGEATIDPATGVLTPVKVGTVKVKAVKAGDREYNDAATAELEVTITQAAPTGTPKYTEITAPGKTLADAALTVAGSDLAPNAGTLEWVDDEGNVLPDTTAVEENTTYRWRFTPDDANYTRLTGSVELYHKDYFTIVVIAGANGSVTPAEQVSVGFGSDQVFTFSPDEGYVVTKVLVDGQSVGAADSYTFRNVTANHVIEVIFMKRNGNPQTGVDVPESGSRETVQRTVPVMNRDMLAPEKPRTRRKKSV